MAICKNCKSSLGCSCQVRMAKDGKSCCTKCLESYNQKISNNKDMTLKDLSKITGIKHD